MTDRSYTRDEKVKRMQLIAKGVAQAARGKSTAVVDWQIDRIDARAELRHLDERKARHVAQRDLDAANAEAKAADLRIKAKSVREDTAQRIKDGKKGWF